MTAQAIQKTFGKNVRTLRETCTWTETMFARALGIDVEELAKLEAGQSWPSPDLVAGMAHVLEIEPAELFTRHIENSSESRSIQGMDTPGTISTMDAAKILGVTKFSVCRYIEQGLLDATRIGTVWVVTRASVENLSKTPRPGRGRPKKAPAVA